MKHMFAGLCLLSLLIFSASAQKLQPSQYSLKALFGSNSKEAAKEAVLVGRILRQAAHELAKNENHGEAERDEYSFKSLWMEIVGAIKQAARQIWSFIKQLAKDIKNAAKETAIAVLEAAGEALRKKATEKSIEIVTKIMQKSTATYSSHKFQTKSDIVKDIAAQMDLVGQHLIEKGKGILAH